MEERSLIIIGAGLAGLSAGLYGRMNGYGAHIFEHHTVPGGVAAAWRRKGFLIDGGIHFMMGHRPGQTTHELYRELGILEDNEIEDLDLYISYREEASGRRIDLGSDLERFRADLTAISPADAGPIDKLVSAAMRWKGMEMAMGMDQPAELLGVAGQFRQMWKMRGILRTMLGSFGKPVEQYTRHFRDPFVRDIINYLFLPEVPVWFVLMLLGMLAGGQLGRLKRSSLDLALALSRRLEKLGGRISYQATVEEILVEGDRAVGVRLADGSEHRAEVVISAADGHSTIFEMLHGRYVNRRIVDRYQRWKLCKPLLMASFGLARDLPDEPYMNLFKPEQPLQIAGEEHPWLFYRVYSGNDHFCPPGKSILQATLETPWEFWYEIQQDRPRYEAEKERVASEILRRLEGLIPGISGLVEVTDVYTPYTTWRYTRNHHGAYEGWLITPRALMSRIERTLPGLENFLMAGQWVVPGGGVPPCLFSGRQAIQVLCHRDGKGFRTSLA